MTLRAGHEVLGSFDGAQVEADENPFGVREIADDLLHRLRKLAHQGRDREYLIALGELRVFQKIDHLYTVSPREMRLAQPLQVLEGSQTLWSLSRDIESQLPGFGPRGPS